MVRYISKPAPVSNEEVSVDEKVVQYVSDLYRIGEELGMESEFTDVELQDSEHSVEYFETKYLGYDAFDVPQIQQVEMELELEEGEINARYDDDSQVFEINFPEHQRRVFEDVLGEEFSMGARDRMRNTASVSLEALRNRKNQILP